MTIHYHGLPLTPAEDFETMRGRHFCLSWATCAGRAAMIQRALQIGQSRMYDNGAFSVFTQGAVFRPDLFYAWVESYIGHPDWAVVPDVIGGTVEEQRQLHATWPFPRAFGAPVWHLHLPLDFLLELTDEWPRVCLGSSGSFWQVGGPQWTSRMHEVFAYLARHRQYMPWLHGLRMLSQVGKNWPLASADSVNVARNFKCQGQVPGAMADRIDSVNGPRRYIPRTTVRRIACTRVQTS